MKIALINTPSLFTYGKIKSGHPCSFTMGLGYLAAYVGRAGHAVRIFDPEPCKMPIPNLWEAVGQFGPDLIGFTCVTPNYSLARSLVRQAKRLIKSPVIMGGPHVSALPKSTLENISELDGVIIGEGEIPLLGIAEHFDKHKTFDLAAIPNAAYFHGGTYIQNPRAALIEDLDSLPLPARELVDIRLYKLHPHFARGERSATVLSSRGCPSTCTFCANQYMGRRFRPRSAQNFVHELEYLIQTHEIRHFHIIDDCFTIDKNRVIEICDLIIQKKLEITWFIFGRVNNLQDEDLIRKLKEAGCVFILLGIESGNQEILKTMKKGITLEMAERCCGLLSKHKIQFINSFIIGNEGDTMETVNQTIRFARKLKSVFAGFNMLIPFPGTPIFEKYFSDYDRPETDWDHWCSVADDLNYEPRQTKLTRQQILSLTSAAYRKFYLNPAQLLRILSFVRNFQTLQGYLLGGLALLRQMVSWSRKGKA